jgi:hypothetical protein
MSESITLRRSKYTMARRRINIALCTLEDGFYDLLSPENVVELLTSALSDLDEAEVVGQMQGSATVERGLDWNAYESVTGGAHETL